MAEVRDNLVLVDRQESAPYTVAYDASQLHKDFNPDTYSSNPLRIIRYMGRELWSRTLTTFRQIRTIFRSLTDQAKELLFTEGNREITDENGRPYPHDKLRIAGAIRKMALSGVIGYMREMQDIILERILPQERIRADNGRLNVLNLGLGPGTTAIASLELESLLIENGVRNRTVRVISTENGPSGLAGIKHVAMTGERTLIINPDEWSDLDLISEYYRHAYMRYEFGTPLPPALQDGLMDVVVAEHSAAYAPDTSVFQEWLQPIALALRRDGGVFVLISFNGDTRERKAAYEEAKTVEFGAIKMLLRGLTDNSRVSISQRVRMAYRGVETVARAIGAQSFGKATMPSQLHHEEMADVIQKVFANKVSIDFKPLQGGLHIATIVQYNN